MFGVKETEVDTKALRKGFGSAAGSKAQVAAYQDALTKAADEIDRLREFVEIVAAPLQIDGVNHMANVYRARDLLTPNS